MINLPPSNLQGTYESSCVVCMRGTDSGLAFRGVAEWATAGLMVLGVPDDQAAIIISTATGSDPGKVPAGEITVPVRVCQDCVKDSGTGMTVGLLPDIPVYRHSG